MLRRLDQLERDDRELRGVEEDLAALRELAAEAEAAGGAGAAALRGLAEEAAALEARARAAARRSLLDHPDDERGAVVLVDGLAGDSLWVEDLVRILARWVERHRAEAHLVHEVERLSGTRQLILELPFRHAHGQLAGEAGLHEHRWIPPHGAPEKEPRISLARVTVLPEAEDDEVPIAPEDLEIRHVRGVSCCGPRCRAWVRHRATELWLPYEGGEARRRAHAVIRAHFHAQSRGVEPSPRRELPVRIYTSGRERVVEDPRTGARTEDVEAVWGGDIELFIDAWLSRRG